jgi:hypothetical protein
MASQTMDSPLHSHSDHGQASTWLAQTMAGQAQGPNRLTILTQDIASPECVQLARVQTAY